ncbi:hypothetical protein C7K38_07955 [Tetragenococcus osmophilus]|uniref:Cyclophilin-like domain-containing protein n=1 Tax=Tetragenococcus osmophilus TaxID=526944 RepID=A0AA38CVC1_9ENTE|nr:cyclophilin-like fold protein [Tetragenococcus osmophilus]AYW48298.1 hypothetical protein C7K38_07955 [Tetragenococcus osmophilus]GMA54105.1 hypothetical protein GCM10025857_54620 [Alicyclobacillus contaminans]GMA72008.1 hypothetical protein GCM10025885_10570 [Tetragenococcus osmophilus]
MDKILLTVNNTTFSASLLDNALADKFMEQLPLTMDMSELNASEKFYSFSESFPVQGERVGKIEKGDLMFFGSDTFVLFYKSFSTPYSYTRLGTLDQPENLQKAVGRKGVTVRIEEAKS